MEPLLFLVHRIPYPPNKGDKIRSYNILRYLCQHYQVFLGCFVDDKADLDHLNHLRTLCRDVHAVNVNPLRAKCKSLIGLLTNTPLTLTYYQSRSMSHWVTNTLTGENIQHCIVFSSSMAQYVDSPEGRLTFRIIDFVDMDSDKWNQYKTKTPWPLSWIYAREASTLFRYEKKIANEFDHSVFVTEEETELFLSLCRDDIDKQKIGTIENGVDTEFFDPKVELPSVNLPKNTIIFTGAMDYRANIDAVVWFVQEVWPRVQKKCTDLHFYIVGGNPNTEVKQLESQKNITVTGRVPDIRPYMQEAQLAVAPLRIARGIQNKVLEAMAMSKPVIATSMAMEGIKLKDMEDKAAIGIADSAENMAESIIEVFKPDANKAKLVLYSERAQQANREFVCQNYNWQAKLSKFKQLITDDSPGV